MFELFCLFFPFSYSLAELFCVHVFPFTQLVIHTLLKHQIKLLRFTYGVSYVCYCHTLKVFISLKLKCTQIFPTYITVNSKFFICFSFFMSDTKFRKQLREKKSRTREARGMLGKARESVQPRASGFGGKLSAGKSGRWRSAGNSVLPDGR